MIIFREDVATRIFKDSSGNERPVMIMRDLTGRKRAESPRDVARDALARQNDALSKLNHFSIELSTLSPQDDLEAFITKRIKEIAGAVAAIFFVFNPENRTTTTQRIEMDPGLLEKVVSLLGKQVEKIHSTVSDEMYRKVTTEIIGMRKTLHDVTFGAVSRPVGAAIKALLKADRFIGIAYLIEGKLYGTSLLAMSQGQPDPSKLILENFSFLAALALRRKQAEGALQISLEKYRVLFESFPLGITISDKAGKIIEANRQSEQLLGITSEAQSQRKIDSKEWQIIRKDGTPMPADEYASTRALRENRLIENVEMGIVKDKGEIIWINVTAAPISLEGYGVAIAYGDITERKRAEEELKKSSQLLRDTGEMAKVGGWELDLSTKEVLWTEEVYRIHGVKLGYKPKLGDAMSFYAPESRPALEEALKKVAETGEPFDLESLFIPSGSKDKIWVRSLGKAVYSGGEIVKLAGTFQNIDKYKRAVEALRESEVRYRELFENIHSGVAVYTVIGNGQDFIFKDLNPAGERIDRDRRERLIGKSIFEVRPIIEQFGLIEVFRKVWRTGEPAYHPVTLYQDGKLSGWYENHVYKLPSGEIVAVFENVTERKRADETLRSSEGLLQKIFDILPVGLWFADKDGKLLRGNPIGVKIWGAEPKVDPSEYGVFKARRLPSGEEVAPDDWALAHTIRDKVTIIDELLEIDAFDGRKKTILNYTAPVLDAKGDVQGAIVVNQDITERVQAEKEIQSLARFPSENPGPILRIARDGTLLYINPAGLSLLPEWHMQEGQAAPSMMREVAFQAMDSGSTQMLDLEYGRRVYSFSFMPVVGSGYANLYGRDVTERRYAEEELRKSESNLRALAIELSRVEEGERQRLALFLHDEIGQSLALVRMMFGSLTQTSKLKSEKQHIQQIRDLLEKVIDQTHTLTFELSPPVLHQLGLEAAIEWAGEKICHDHGIEFIFNDDGRSKLLDADLKALLFRWVRELMMNILKHAKARKVTVSLKRTQNQLTIIVEDNGIGFDTSLLERQLATVGFGLFSIRERLAAIGGTFDLWSEPGRGTRLTLSVSLKDEGPSSSAS